MDRLPPPAAEPPPAKRVNRDRFIPRKASPVNFSVAGEAGPARGEYSAGLSALLGAEEPGEEAPRTPVGSQRKVLFFGSQTRTGSATRSRPDACAQLDSRELKVLDAPGMLDSFYPNLLSFSSADVLAVGLGGELHLFGFSAARSRPLFAERDGPLTSVCFSGANPALLAFGAAAGTVRVVETGEGAVLRQFAAGEGRVVALAWQGELLATGTRGGEVLLRDLRCKASRALALVPHEQEVCTLAFSPFDAHQLLSGSNDDSVALSDLRAPQRECARFRHHRAAVKALCWHPGKRGLFASGGGARDQTLALVDSARAELLRSVALSSQICNAGFNRDGQLLVSTGFPALSLQVIDAQSLALRHAFTGHTDRLLYMSVTADRGVAATGSPDETIRYWAVAGGRTSKSAPPKAASRAAPLR